MKTHCSIQTNVAEGHDKQWYQKAEDEEGEDEADGVPLVGVPDDAASHTNALEHVAVPAHQRHEGKGQGEDAAGADGQAGGAVSHQVRGHGVHDDDVAVNGGGCQNVDGREPHEVHGEGIERADRGALDLLLTPGINGRDGHTDETHEEVAEAEGDDEDVGGCPELLGPGEHHDSQSVEDGTHQTADRHEESDGVEHCSGRLLVGDTFWSRLRDIVERGYIHCTCKKNGIAK